MDRSIDLADETSQNEYTQIMTTITAPDMDQSNNDETRDTDAEHASSMPDVNSTRSTAARGRGKGRGRGASTRGRGRGSGTTTTARTSSSSSIATRVRDGRGRGRGRGRGMTTTTNTRKRKTISTDDSDSESDVLDTEMEDINREVQSQLSNKYSENNDPSASADERDIYCSARCIHECKSCVCAKARYICDPEKCKCTNCCNLTGAKDDPLQSWTINSFPSKSAVFDSSKSGPSGIPNPHKQTVNTVVDLLWTDAIWNHLSHESSAYKTYCVEFSKELGLNRKSGDYEQE